MDWFNPNEAVLYAGNPVLTDFKVLLKTGIQAILERGMEGSLRLVLDRVSCSNLYAIVRDDRRGRKTSY